MKKKTLVTALALVLVVCCAVGGVLAWLTDKTDALVNTFTVGDINIDLAETTGESYKMVPGNDIAKDPKVTVEANSEACWLFVKVEKSANFDTFMTCAMAEGWTQLAGVDGVYYREVAATTADVEYAVLAGDKVSVKGDVTKEMLTAKDFTQPTLTFTAYAIQQANFATADAAWAEVSK